MSQPLGNTITGGRVLDDKGLLCSEMLLIMAGKHTAGHPGQAGHLASMSAEALSGPLRQLIRFRRQG